MMARNTNVSFKGRIQKRKTNHLQIITFSLQRAAGPYRSAITSCEQMQQVAPLFDDFVGSREQCSRHFEAERFGGLDVEHGFVFRRSLRREVGWFLAFQDAVDVGGGQPIQRGLINPEGDQSAFGDETAEVWDRMEP